MTVSNRVAAVLVMAALFLMGAVAGGVAVGVVTAGDEAPRARWERDGRRAGPGERGDRFRGPRGFAAAGFVDRMDRELELDDAQRDSVAAILESQRQAAEATLRDVAPRLRAGVDSAHEQIRRVLDDGQRARFDALLQRDRGFPGGPGLRGRRDPGGPRR